VYSVKRFDILLLLTFVDGRPASAAIGTLDLFSAARIMEA